MPALGGLLLLSALLSTERVYTAVPERRWLKDNIVGISYVCPYRGSISMVVSQYNNKTEERVWDFACKSTFQSHVSCSWTDYVNRFDEGINFSCPSEALICGVENLRGTIQKDRKWRFYCCEAGHVCLRGCAWSPYINQRNEYFSWEVPADHYLAGIVRHHGNQSGERRWQFRYCAMFSTNIFAP
ncbi:hemagglutinin/amebocyte aggregation factor-like isoform X2 [Hypanus sabinus]|uniref:hemagglutinin/amebocyte aggregation factor-like isoform X2 n=1 Tax=Hypanus sabinus TaxID=79690 RepID=UPI0028C495DD|nr:hemagglutinin/amebocyte aggregation factor-like isoform X2 [Hypanus sabinus]